MLEFGISIVSATLFDSCHPWFDDFALFKILLQFVEKLEKLLMIDLAIADENRGVLGEQIIKIFITIGVLSYHLNQFVIIRCILTHYA